MVFIDSGEQIGNFISLTLHYILQRQFRYIGTISEHRNCDIQLHIALETLKTRVGVDLRFRATVLHMNSFA